MSASRPPLTLRFSMPTVPRVKRIMGAAARSQTLGESAKVPRVERLQHLHRGPLDDFIVQCRELHSTLPRCPNRLRNR
jgi:hypothetical protein